MGKNIDPEAQKLKRKEQRQRKKQHRAQFQKKWQEVQTKIKVRDEQTSAQDESNAEPYEPLRAQPYSTDDFAEDGSNVLTGKYYDYFKGVFERNRARAIKYYSALQAEKDQLRAEKEGANEAKQAANETETDPNAPPKLSKKQIKKLRWLKVAELKAMVKRPDLVEAWDITAPDPLFLCEMKMLKNTIGVPRHWNQKSKFLQTKRGILKPMFKLPEFIEATGISKLRDPFTQRDGQKMVRQKLRERMNPRLGKIDIDYAVLHDAFFKYQLKGELTVFGDVFYEGKEDEGKAKQYKPGQMSQALRQALGIADFQAPPWLINMQRFGAPPSYPTLRILGSNVPFSQLTSYSMVNKTTLEQTARKLAQPGLYATFRTYDEEEVQDDIDRGYWGQITHTVEPNENQPSDGWAEDQQV